jgi:hypothetical protein
MTDQVDIARDDAEWALFEELGRRAAADLRAGPPAAGLRAVERTARRRRAATAVAGGAAVVVAIVGWFTFIGSPHDEPGDGPVSPPPISPVAPTTTLSPLPVGVPGTWRSISSSDLAPEFARAAVWTGTEAIVLGVRSLSDAAVPVAAAYNARTDTWRQLADIPGALAEWEIDSSASVVPAVPPQPQWTGSELLAAAANGDVFSYDPSSDRWTERAAAPDAADLSPESTVLGVSPAGVLAASASGWWWYDAVTDEWGSVPSPGDGFEPGSAGAASSPATRLGSLASDTMVATNFVDSTVRVAVYDTAHRNWAPVVELAGPPNQRGLASCEPVDGLVACWSEGYGTLNGIIVDPAVGQVGTFELGNHASALDVDGIPWFAHAWKLLSPTTQTWEDLAPLDDVDGFNAAVWTGSELIFFGGLNAESGQPRVSAAAYTPLGAP